MFLHISDIHLSESDENDSPERQEFAAGRKRDFAFAPAAVDFVKDYSCTYATQEETSLKDYRFFCLYNTLCYTSIFYMSNKNGILLLEDPILMKRRPRDSNSRTDYSVSTLAGCPYRPLRQVSLL